MDSFCGFMVVELGVAMVWFDFDFDFVGCRDFDFDFDFDFFFFFFFVLEDDFGFQLMKISLGTKFWR